jgi:hypothetical protein
MNPRRPKDEKGEAELAAEAAELAAFMKDLKQQKQERKAARRALTLRHSPFAAGPVRLRLILGGSAGGERNTDRSHLRVIPGGKSRILQPPTVRP